MKFESGEPGCASTRILFAMRTAAADAQSSVGFETRVRGLTSPGSPSAATSGRIRHIRSRVVTLASMALLLVVITPHYLLAQSKPQNARHEEDLLHNLVEKHFAHWDRDHNNVLELIEVDHLIEDHSVHGQLAALIVRIRFHMTEKGHKRSLPHQQLLKLVQDHNFAQSVERTAKHLETIDRELFLPTDPELHTFSQGNLNDCYLLSAIAAQVHRNPKAIRGMIHVEVTGGFHVIYGDGQKIAVTPLTESELLLGANLDHRHGSWLAVLEKSYGVIRRHERTKKNDKTAAVSSTIPSETLDWGDCAVIISLMTGHHTDSLQLGKSSHPDQVHELLTNMTHHRHLVCCGTNHEKPPPGMGSNHVYAVLGYDVNNRHVNVFNPWGNNFSPKGHPGNANGYETKNGHFAVPLAEFHSVFSDVVYETNKPLKK